MACLGQRDFIALIQRVNRSSIYGFHAYTGPVMKLSCEQIDLCAIHYSN